jgi:hypothetical protein
VCSCSTLSTAIPAPFHWQNCATNGRFYCKSFLVLPSSYFMSSRLATMLLEQQNTPPAASTRSTRQQLPLNRNPSGETSTRSTTSAKRKSLTVSMAPAKKASKRSNKTTEAATKAKKVKQKNFTTHEDVLLCKAYVNISTNPVAGTGKKSKDFWKSIKDAFDALMKAEPPEDNEGSVARDHNSVWYHKEHATRSHCGWRSSCLFAFLFTGCCHSRSRRSCPWWIAMT